ncbi:DUF551 domain-containing protein [Kluyvera sp. CRP]|nr:DUF551 domain-containing protein [Kluyvera sp. CRP]
MCEPVAYMTYKGYLLHAGDPKLGEYSEPVPLYAAPPEPIVPDELTREEYKRRFMADDCFDDTFRGGWNACRAAMLNTEKLNQHVSETEALPSGYLQGHQDGLEWAAQMAEANHPQTGDWLHDDPIALAAAIRKGPDMPLASGNSPATPDGWIPVSERMPETMVSVLVTGDWFHHAIAFWDGGSWCDLDFEAPATHWRPLPAMPEEVG